MHDHSWLPCEPENLRNMVPWRPQPTFEPVLRSPQTKIRLVQKRRLQDGILLVVYAVWNPLDRLVPQLESLVELAVE